MIAGAHDVIFFQAIGRSGTQWFARQLADLYGDLAQVTHEPIGYTYQPRKFLRRYDGASQAAMLAIPQVRAHLDQIDRVAADKLYIEIGFPSYAAIPALWERYGSRLKLVHLIRNPVFNAASQLTHGWYDPVARPDLARDILPTPDDEVVQTHYRDSWDGLSGFEKCLFFWSEFHLHALELHARYPSMMYLPIRFEDVFESPRAEETLKKLTEFLGLPWREELLERLSRKEDRWRLKVKNLGDWHAARNHPQVVALALQFGYDLEAIAERQLRDRYLKTSTLPQKIRRRIERRLVRLVRSS